MTRKTFLPSYLLNALRDTEDADLVLLGEHTLEVDERLLRGEQSAVAQRTSSGAAWEVYDANNSSALPGELARSAGESETGDVAVDEAALGVSESLALFSDLGRDSYDDAGATVVTTVHYEDNYNNAAWDGRQLIIGDGDGKVFHRFSAAMDVLGHEFAHAVTQHTAGLVYQGQSGALNESVSDVFGACILQRHLGQRATEASWLIGEGLFTDQINATALRSMQAPGTAYDDPKIGTDPQPAHMDDYVQTSDDNGGVHINSGIPNRAFYLAATRTGGMSWEVAGKIWYAALTSGVSSSSDFAAFAQATIDAAGEHAEVVTRAWRDVGVVPGVGATDGEPSAETVAVVKSGGVAGLTQRGRIDLNADDVRARQAAAILRQINFRHLQMGAATTQVEGADHFVYDFRYSTVRVSVPEPAMTHELKDLATVVLEADTDLR